MILPIFLAYFSLVNDVVGLLNQRDLPAAERTVQAYRAASGSTPELAAAYSWIARGALAARRYGDAESYAARARQTTLEFLKARKLDDDPWLPTALGASIEVQAAVLAARDGRGEAVSYLQGADGAVRRHLDPRAHSEEHQPVEPGGKAGSIPRDARLAGPETSRGGCAARASRVAVLLGALVFGLQSRSGR